MAPGLFWLERRIFLGLHPVPPTWPHRRLLWHHGIPLFVAQCLCLRRQRRGFLEFLLNFWAQNLLAIVWMSRPGTIENEETQTCDFFKPPFCCFHVFVFRMTSPSAPYTTVFDSFFSCLKPTTSSGGAYANPKMGGVHLHVGPHQRISPDRLGVAFRPLEGRGRGTGTGGWWEVAGHKSLGLPEGIRSKTSRIHQKRVLDGGSKHTSFCRWPGC